MLNQISFLLCWYNLHLKHKILSKIYLIEQRFGHFFVYQSTAVNKSSKSSASPPRIQNEHTRFICPRPPQWKQREKTRQTRTGPTYRPTQMTWDHWDRCFPDYPPLQSWLNCSQLCQKLKSPGYFSWPISWRSRSGARSKQTSECYQWRQAFKKRNYEVKVKTHFVLKPSIEIQIRFQVISLN